MAPLQHNDPNPGVSGQAGLVLAAPLAPSCVGQALVQVGLFQASFLLTSDCHLLQGPVTAARTRWKSAAEGGVGAILVTFCYSVISLLKERGSSQGIKSGSRAEVHCRNLGELE